MENLHEKIYEKIKVNNEKNKSPKENTVETTAKTTIKLDGKTENIMSITTNNEKKYMLVQMVHKSECWGTDRDKLKCH